MDRIKASELLQYFSELDEYYFARPNMTKNKQRKRAKKETNNFRANQSNIVKSKNRLQRVLGTEHDLYSPSNKLPSNGRRIVLNINKKTKVNPSRDSSTKSTSQLIKEAETAAIKAKTKENIEKKKNAISNKDKTVTLNEDGYVRTIQATRDLINENNKEIARLSDLHKRSAAAAVDNHNKLKDQIAENEELEKYLDKSHKVIEIQREKNTNLTKDLNKLKGEHEQVSKELEGTTKKLNRSNKTKAQLMEDRESERKRGNKFKKLAIGLGIGAGAAALGAGAIGAKALSNHNRNKAMLTKMSNNFIGRLGMRASGYGSTIPRYRSK